MHDGDPPDLHATGQDGASPDSTTRNPANPDRATPGSLAQDWITVWQSELSAAAADREVQETWQTMAALWAGAAAAMLRGLPRGFDGGDAAAGHGQPRPRAAAAPRPAPAAAAPDARDAEVDRLAGRIAELERRLAELERRP